MVGLYFNEQELLKNKMKYIITKSTRSKPAEKFKIHLEKNKKLGTGKCMISDMASKHMVFPTRTHNTNNNSPDRKQN